MDFDTFKINHSETLMYYQIIEHDLKYIYAFMHKGNVNDNLDEIDKNTLGQIIDKLRKLDNEDNKPNISANDYNFLKQLSKNRNYWAHQVYTDFMYNDNPINSRDYAKACDKLVKDHDRLLYVFRNVEKVRIRLCTDVYRR